MHKLTDNLKTNEVIVSSGLGGTASGYFSITGVVSCAVIRGDVVDHFTTK